MLAGGCETGLDVRAVEGQVHYWWVGLGNVIGSTILAYYWDDFAPALATGLGQNQPAETYGPMGGLLVTYLLFVCSSNVDYRLGKTLLSAVRHRRLLRRSHEKYRS